MLRERDPGNKIVCLIVNTVSVPMKQVGPKSCDALGLKASMIFPVYIIFQNNQAVDALYA